MRRKPVDTRRFSRVRGAQPLYEELAELIRQKVAAGELAPGDRLPGEIELAASLGVSRPSVREALKILRALGVVSIRHGDGVYITAMDAQDIVSRLTPRQVLPPEGLYHLYEVRKTLECQAAAWAAQRATAEHVRELRAIVEQMKGVVENGAPTSDRPEAGGFLDRLEELDNAFHHQVVLATGNSLLVGLMDSLVGMVSESRRYSLSIPGRAIQSVYEHERVLEAVASRRPVAAARAMFVHIDSVQRSVFRMRVGETAASGISFGQGARDVLRVFWIREEKLASGGAAEAE